MARKTISVIIPCKDQADKIDDTMKDIMEMSDKIPYDLEVVFVNDRSKDKSPEIADEYGKKLSRYMRLNTPSDFVGIGKGLAVKMGMSEASGDYRIFMDADNSTSFKEITKLIPYFDKYDVVLGTRYSNKVSEPQNNWFKAFGSAFKDVIEVLIYGHAKRYSAKKKQGRLREFVSRGGNLAFTVLLGQSFSDSRCGFKMYSGKASNDIFPKLNLTGWGFDTEALVLAKKYKFSMVEVPVDWFDDAEASNFRAKDMIDSFVEIFKIYGYTLMGKYKR